MKDGITRVKRGRREAKEHYDKVAPYYDILEGSFEKKYRDMGIDLLGIEELDKILEIGYGTSDSLIEIAKRVRDHAYGIDISTGMAKVTQKKMSRENIQNISLVCGDAVYLPFEDRSFDKIFMSFTLDLIDTPDIPRVIAEINRVLKDEGELGIVCLSSDETIPVNAYEGLHRLFPKYLDCRPISPEKILKDAGFKIIKSMEEQIVIFPIKLVVGKV